MRSVRRILTLAVLVLVTAGCGESATYNTKDVAVAFKRHGYTLGSGFTYPEMPAARGGDVLMPQSGEALVVIVASDGAAEEAWRSYESQQTRESFDARRANVLVISDEGLGMNQRRRVVAALWSLANRGAAVMIAGRK